MEGYCLKAYGMPVKRYVQTMQLKASPEKIAQYREVHSREHHWKEIRDGIRQVGILEMDIYILDTTLVMIVETPVDFDWQVAMDKLATLPRQAEWERYVAQFQDCDPEARSDEKWQLMQRLFHIYENEEEE